MYHTTRIENRRKKNRLRNVIENGIITVLATMLVLTAFASAAPSQMMCENDEITDEAAPIWLLEVNSQEPDQAIFNVVDFYENHSYVVEKGTPVYFSEIDKNLEISDVFGRCTQVTISEVPVPIPSPTPAPTATPEYKLVNITANFDNVLVVIISGINNSSESSGYTPLSLVVYPEEENITLIFSKYGYMTKRVQLVPNATSLYVDLEPESWSIMNFSEIGKITQEEQGITLVYKGITYALEQNVSDGNQHTVSGSDIKITKKSEEWEVEAEQETSRFEKIENVSLLNWYITEEISNKKRIAYTYNVSIGANGESAAVLREANISFGTFGSSSGVTLEGVDASGFFVSIKYHFVNTTMVIMESMETGRANYSRPLTNWLNKTEVPGLNITLAESIGMLQFIPLEGTVVSGSGKVLTKIPTYVTDNPTVWNVIFFKLYQKSELIFKLEEGGAVAGKAIIMKKTSADWGPIFKKIDADREAAGLYVVREAKPVAKDDVVFLLPYPKGKFWEYVFTPGQKRMMVYIEENTNKVK